MAEKAERWRGWAGSSTGAGAGWRRKWQGQVTAGLGEAAAGVEV